MISKDPPVSVSRLGVRGHLDTGGKATGGVPRALRTIHRQRFLLLLLLPGVLLLLVFNYLPIYGVVLAFKEYDPLKGILGGNWVGLKYIRELLRLPDLSNSLLITLLYSLLRLLTEFPATILFALLLNEIVNNTFRKAVQTISYLPHFLSWVVVAGLTISVMSPSMGVYGRLADVLGLKKVVLVTKEVPFVAIVTVSAMWKSIGWGSIIYLAVISGIDPQLYEAATMDGASRIRRVFQITLPSMVPIVTIQLIFTVSGMLNSNFDQIFNLMNPLVDRVANVIDVYLFKVGLQQMRISYATAAGIMRNAVSLMLFMVANFAIRRVSEYTLF